MTTISAIPKVLITISVTVVLLCGGIFLWQCRCRYKGPAQTDRQTVWLLIGLLIVAAISMGVFLFTLLLVHGG